MKDAGDKLPAEQQAKANAAIADAKKHLESNDGARMKSALEKLQAAGGEIYAAAQAAAQASGATASAEPKAETEAGEKSAKEARRRRCRLRGRRRRQE